MPCCLVRTCKNRGNIPGISYYRIPKNNYQAWLRALKKPALYNQFSLKNTVCSIHFKPEDFINIPNAIKQLKVGAVPSLHLDNSTNEKNSNEVNNTISTYSKKEPFANTTTKFRSSTLPVLLPSVFNPAPNTISKSQFMLIDINSIKNKTNITAQPSVVKNSDDLLSTSDSVSFISEIHNYCNATSDKSETSSQIGEVKLEDNDIKDNILYLHESFERCNTPNSDMENLFKKSDKDLNRKLRAYKKAYKKQKTYSKKQKEKISLLEQKYDECIRTNKNLEQRIDILNNIIQNLLKKREERLSED